MWRRPVFVVLAVVAMLVAAPAGAHTEVQRATPGPGEVVEGAVDEIVLVFLDEIMSDATVAVSGPSGTVPTGAVVHDGRTVRVSVEGAVEPGDYVVRYAFTALDGDHQTEAYRFRVVEPGSRGVPVGAVVGVVGLLGALAAAIVRRRGDGRVDSP